MGCDIHVFVEKRLDKSLPWTLDEHHSVEETYTYRGEEFIRLFEVGVANRDYSLFAILATVRAYGDSTNCREARGLPLDLSETLKRCASGPDWHSHSYMSLDEFTECLQEAGYKPDGTEIGDDAFFDWRAHNYNPARRPKDYTPIITYCREWLDLATAEAELLDTGYRPEVRVVFWFDN